MTVKPQVLLVMVFLVAMVQGITPASVSLSDVPASGVTVRIDFGNGTSLTYPNVEGADVLAATESVAEVEATWYGDLVFVIAIAGVHQDPVGRVWWQYWVNGELGPIAANKFQLHDNDTVEWRRQSSQMTTEPSGSPDISTVAATIAVAACASGFLYIIYRRKSGGQ